MSDNPKVRKFKVGQEVSQYNEKEQAFFKYVNTEFMDKLGDMYDGLVLGLSVTCIVDDKNGVSARSFGLTRQCDCPPQERHEHVNEIGEMIIDAMAVTVREYKNSHSRLADDPPPLTVEEVNDAFRQMQENAKKEEDK